MRWLLAAPSATWTGTSHTDASTPPWTTTLPSIFRGNSLYGDLEAVRALGRSYGTKIVRSLQLPDRTCGQTPPLPHVKIIRSLPLQTGRAGSLLPCHTCGNYQLPTQYNVSTFRYNVK